MRASVPKQSARSPRISDCFRERDCLRKAIAAFEDEQRQHDTALKVAWEDGRENGLADSKPQEAVCSRCAAVFGWTPKVAAFGDKQRRTTEQAQQLLDTIYDLNVRASKALDYLRKQRVDFGILQRVRAILDGGDDA